MSLIRRPLVPGAVAFVAGAVIGAPDGLGPGLGALAGSAVAAGALARRGRLTAPIALVAVFFFAGFVAGAARRPPSHTVAEAFGGKLPTGRVIVEGRVRGPPSGTERGARYLLDLTGVGPGPVPGPLSSARGRIRLFVAGDGLGAPPRAAAGARVRAWAKLRIPPPREFPGGFSARDWAERAGFSLEASASAPEHLVVVVPAPREASVLARLDQLRAEVHAAIDRHLSADVAGLVRALATGDKSGLRPADQDAIRDAGLAHLTAVSGFHLGVVAWLWLTGLGAGFRRWRWLAEGFGADRAAALASLPVVVLYPLFVGSTPSAVRAGIMFGLLLVGRLVHRGREAWSAVAAALLVMAAVDPASLHDPGLQLSFAAVASLLALPSAIDRRLGVEPNHWPGPLRFAYGALGASVAATVGTLPFVAWHFGRLSVIGILANIPAALVAAAAVPLALAGGLLSVLSPSAGALVLSLAGFAAKGLLLIAYAAARVPGGVLTLPPPTGLEIGLFVLLVLHFAAPAGGLRRRRMGRLLLVALVGAVLISPVSRWMSTQTRITFLPVGQGDGIVIELPRGKVVVLDAGPGGQGSDAGERVLAPFLRARRIGRVDLFILTHPHADHLGGLTGLLAAVPIGRVWWSGDEREGPRSVLDALERLPREPLVPGLRFSSGAAVIELLAPLSPVESYASVNDASIVVRLSHGARSILLTGDAEVDGEARLVGEHGAQGLEVDILKAGHHGSRSSSNRPLLDAARPRHVIISCGRNNGFGFPHKEALERIGPEPTLWRTDQQGAITVKTNGETLTIEGFLPRPEHPR